MNEFKSLESNIWKIYLRKIISSFALFTPVIVLFFLDNGLSMTEVALLQTAYSVTVVGLEVPSGYFADLYGRRTSLTLSGLFLAAGIGLYSIGTGFYEFLLAEMIFGVGAVLESGVLSAVMYDSLQELDLEDKYNQIWGKATFYGLVSVAVASILGGFIGEFSLRAAIMAMVPLYILLIPLSLSLREPSKHEDLKDESSRKLKGILKYCVNSVKIRWLVVYAAIIAAAGKSAYYLYQPYFQISGIQVAYFGLIFAGLSIISAVAARKAYTLENFLGRRKSLLSLLGVTVAAITLLGFFQNIAVVVFAACLSAVRGFSKPVISDYLNGLISSEMRATVLSVRGLVSRAAFAVSFPVVGLVVDTYSYQVAFNVIAASTGFIGLLAFILLLRHWR
ncbi:MFS transporter [Candidatus Nanosalina sp. VS9-1]|uniref:MFS transporter n=1 Tax=Candidatus Nanosalina sp. VS9-1 TaxID=3388566 RepID=UPI0039E1CE31